MMTEEEIERAARARVDAVFDGEEVEAVRLLLQDEYGRRALWQVLEHAGLYQLSFRPGSSAEETAFREGRRSVGLYVLNLIFTANPEAYTILRTEAAARAERKRLTLEREFEKGMEEDGV